MYDDRQLMTRLVVVMAVAFPFFFIPDVLGSSRSDLPEAPTQKAVCNLALAAIVVCTLAILFIAPLSEYLEEAAGLLRLSLAIRPPS